MWVTVGCTEGSEISGFASKTGEYLYVYLDDVNLTLPRSSATTLVEKLREMLDEPRTAEAEIK